MLADESNGVHALAQPLVQSLDLLLHLACKFLRLDLVLAQIKCLTAFQLLLQKFEISQDSVSECIEDELQVVLSELATALPNHVFYEVEENVRLLVGVVDRFRNDFNQVLHVLAHALLEERLLDELADCELGLDFDDPKFGLAF